MPESFKISQDRLERGRTAPPYITAVDKIGGVTSKILNVVGVGGVQSVCRSQVPVSCKINHNVVIDAIAI